MFQSLKQKLTEKFATQDPLDKRIGDLVDRATSELLIGPDWSLNMELVDVITSQPSVCSEKASKALHRSLLKHNAKVQLLTLTALETCLKNCGPVFYTHFATSAMFQDMQKLAADTGVHRVDAEVKDKMLCLIEDCSKGIRQVPGYREAYDSLLDQGVDFPVRPEDDQTPFLTEPAPPPPAPAAVAHGFDDVSEEDRAAIAAAMAEMEAEARAQEQRDARAATAMAAAAAAAAPRPAAPAATSPGGRQAAAPVAAGYVPPPAVLSPGHVSPSQAAPVPPPPMTTESVANEIQVAKNTGELLVEMLGTVTDADPSAVRESFISEIVERCVQSKARMEDYIQNLTDEKLLEDCFGVHEELQKGLARYNELCAKADAATFAAVAAVQAADAAAAPTSLPSPGRLPVTTAPAANFTLIDEEDEEAEEESLQTRRQVPPIPPPPVHAAPEDDYGMPAPPPVLKTTLDQPDLIDFDGPDVVPQTHATPVVPVAATIITAAAVAPAVVPPPPPAAAAAVPPPTSAVQEEEPVHESVHESAAAVDESALPVSDSLEQEEAQETHALLPVSDSALPVSDTPGGALEGGVAVAEEGGDAGESTPLVAGGGLPPYPAVQHE